MAGPADRPLIGVPAQTLQAIDGIPKGLPPSWVMNRRYFDALEAAGASTCLLPLTDDGDALRGLYGRLDGVFLAGGVDLDPASYGQAVTELCGRIDPPRDRIEIALATWAVADTKPLLGVCRGLQVLNVAMGGSLFQDIARLRPASIKHDYLPNEGNPRDLRAHIVTLEPDSRLARIYGTTAIHVNSMHHQAVDRQASGLRPVGVAPDGLVEAMEIPGSGFAVAVQWHPESLFEDDVATRRLFEAFVQAARAYHSSSFLDPVG
jgi:putative glutamine amidotransferase